MAELTTTTNKKNTSLQALRALAFMGTFLTHAGFPYVWSGIVVPVFLSMSGYLMYVNYENREVKCGLVDNFKFAFNKVKKLYALYFITLMACLAFNVYTNWRDGGWCHDYLVLTIKRVLFHVPLLQCWYPDISMNVALNGPAWYISTSVFMYFIFPWLFKFMKGKKNWLLIIIGLAYMALEVYICTYFVWAQTTDSGFYNWFTYTFPVFRVTDFYIGMLAGKIYSDAGKPKLNLVWGTLIELATVGFCIFTWHVEYMYFVHWDNLTLAVWEYAYLNWSSEYVLCAAVLVFVFAMNSGIFTKLINNPVLVALGNISAEAYLIHWIVLEITNDILEQHQVVLTTATAYVKLVVMLAIVVGLSILYRYIKTTINKRRVMKNAV